MIYLIAFGMLLWLLMEDGWLYIYHDTMWRWDAKTQIAWNPTHGPQSWPWWRLITVRVVWMDGSCADPGKRKIGVRIWLYTRWVDSHVDILVPTTDHNG